MSAQAAAAGGNQSRRMSLVEAIANVAVGYGLAVLTQMLVFPIFGLQTSLSDNLAIGMVFTIVSIARSYTLRRAFEAIRARDSGAIAAGYGVRRHRPF
jgi:hypothetical protein